MTRLARVLLRPLFALIPRIPDDPPVPRTSVIVPGPKTARKLDRRSR